MILFHWIVLLYFKKTGIDFKEQYNVSFDEHNEHNVSFAENGFGSALRVRRTILL